MEDRRDLDPALPARRPAPVAAAPPKPGLGGPALLATLPALSRKAACAAGPGYLSIRSQAWPPPWAARAGLHRSRGTTRRTRHGAHPADRQRMQDFGVNDDRELSRLRAEALGKRLIGSLGRIGPPAFLFSWLRRGQGSRRLTEASRTCRHGLAGAALAELPMSPADSC
jgi:hypothetical protein